MSKKTIISVVLVILLILLGLTVFLFRTDIQNLLGFNSNKNLLPAKDFRGEAITLTAGTRMVSIPTNFNEEVLTYLKQGMTEKGGLPLVIEKKGNPLPFGIP